MKLTKDGVIQEVEDVQLNKYFAAGWTPADTEQADDEVIRLKPAVKTRATVNALDEANISKGDE